MLHVTPEASKNIKAIMAERKLDSPLRLEMGGGCGGARLDLTLDEERENDVKLEVDGLTYLIAQDLADQAGKVTLDFVDNEQGRGIKIDTEKPLAAPTCGCGCSC